MQLDEFGIGDEIQKMNAIFEFSFLDFLEDALFLPSPAAGEAISLPECARRRCAARS